MLKNKFFLLLIFSSFQFQAIFSMASSRNRIAPLANNARNWWQNSNMASNFSTYGKSIGKSVEQSVNPYAKEFDSFANNLGSRTGLSSNAIKQFAKSRGYRPEMLDRQSLDAFKRLVNNEFATYQPPNLQTISFLNVQTNPYTALDAMFSFSNRYLQHLKSFNMQASDLIQKAKNINFYKSIQDLSTLVEVQSTKIKQELTSDILQSKATKQALQKADLLKNQAERAIAQLVDNGKDYVRQLSIHLHKDPKAALAIFSGLIAGIFSAKSAKEDAQYEAELLAHQAFLQANQDAQDADIAQKAQTRRDAKQAYFNSLASRDITQEAQDLIALDQARLAQLNKLVDEYESEEALRDTHAAVVFEGEQKARARF
jgi:hypothetical protein